MAKLTPEQALSELVADAQELGIYEQQAEQPTPSRAEASEGGDPWRDVKKSEFLPAQGFHTYYRADLVDRACAATEAQIAALRGALAFYANPFGRVDADGEPVRVPDFYAEMEFGERARVALVASTEPDRARAAVEAQHRAERDGAFEAHRIEKDALAARVVELCDERDALRSELKDAHELYDALTAQIAALREALRKADEGIVRGQACGSEIEFVRWTHEVQALRPSATLLAATEGGTK